MGYYSYDLSPKSNRKIVVVCDVCGKQRIIEKCNYRPLCRSCAQNGKRIKTKCAYCGKVIYLQPAKISEKYGNFCSRACYADWLSTNKRGETHPRYKRIKTKCAYCGKEILFKPSGIKETHGNFCSSRCRGKWRSVNIRGEKHPRYDKTRIKTKCALCGKDLYLREYQIRTHNFCSQECYHEWDQGENSYNWKNGKSFEPYCEKFNDAFKERIRAKFGNKCFICGKTEADNGKKLAVHHVDYDKTCLCNTGNSCQFVPLCASCHSKTNGNRDYWQEYIMSKLRSRLDGYYI